MNQEVQLDESQHLLSEDRPEVTGLPSIAPNRAWFRLAYVCEFLLAVIAAILLWSEVGGQGHLDLMPWWAKLGCVFGWAWCTVRFTAAIVEEPGVWTGRSVRWLTGVLLFSILVAGITFYYHLHEQSDEGDDDTAATVSVTAGRCLGYPSDRTSS